jgi:hypothetical protein
MDHHSPSIGILDILRNTLFRLEQTPEFRGDDPAVIELKRHIVRSISEMEVIRASQFRPEPEGEFSDTLFRKR